METTVHDKALESGWQLLASDEQADYLYKSYPMSSLSEALQFVGGAAALITKAKLDTTSHLSLDSRMVTISLNYPAKHAPTDTHFSLAVAIDALKP